MAAVSQQQLKRDLPAEAMDASAAAAAAPTTTPVVVSPADAARDPLAAVAALHSARVSSLVLSSSSPSPSAMAEDGDWGVTELFRAVAEDESLAKTIPTLTAANVDSIPQHALVRYRGMVQDTLDPEYYLGAYKKDDGEHGSDGGEWATTKFADTVPAAAAAAAAAAAGEAAGASSSAFAPCCVHSAAAAAAIPAPPPAAAVWERRPLYCVSVPGEAADAIEGGEGENKAPAVASAVASAAAKRGRDGGDDEMEAAGAEKELAAAASDAADKKKKGSEREKKRENGASEASAGGGSGADDSKPQPPRPLPPRAGDAMVFFYPARSSASDFSPRLNDVVEVWGVLSRVPELAAAHLDAVGDGSSSLPWPAASELAARPPTSAVPRLHALFLRRAERHPALAAVARERGFAAAAADDKASPAAAAAAAAPSPSASAARAAALARLRRALGGDNLAAEYLLLQLVSRVHLRTAGMALGTLALNITRCPPGGGEAAAGSDSEASPSSSSALSAFAASVAEALSALAPRSVALPLSLRALNSRRLRPGRCPLSGRLAQAPLQLAPGTQVLLDETLLGPGALSATGRDSVDALRGLLADRAVEYDFGYCRGSMPADAPVTILSSGKSGSVLRAHVDLAVPLQAGSDAGAGAEGAEEQREVVAAAALFDTMRTSEFSFGEDDGDDAMDDADGSAQEKKRGGGGAPRWLEEKLLEARRRGSDAAAAASSAAASAAAGSSAPPAPTSEADLHLALTLARLYALSHGETVLRKEHWERVERLEEARGARLAGVAAAVN